MKINDYISKIKKLNACEEAVLDAHNYKTSQELWDNCKRGDWMLWLVGNLSGEPESDKRKKLVLVACKCARLALSYAEENEEVCLKAISVAEDWANGKATINNVSAPAAAASAASASSAATAGASAAATAAYAAAGAAYAAASAATAGYAAYAAASVGYAAYAAAGYAEKNNKLNECADIVRKEYPNVDDLFLEIEK